MRALLFLVLSVSFALLSHCSPTAHSAEDCADPLACYLSSLTLAYPEPISFDVSGVAVELSQLTIHGLDIGGLPSAYVPDVTLNLSALELGTSLSFHYKAVVPKKPRPVTGDISVSLAHTNLSLSLYVPKTDAFSSASLLPPDAHNAHSSQNLHAAQTEEEPSSSSPPLLLPLSVSFSACAVSPVSITVVPITPHNAHTQDTQDASITDDTHVSRSLQELPFSLEELVQTLLHEVVCVRLNTTLAHNVTAWLQESVDPSLAEMASHTAAPLPLSPQKHTLAWNESVLQSIHTLVDRVSGRANLPEFVRCLGESSKSEFLSISEDESIVTRTLKQVLSLPWMLNDEMEIDLSAHALAFSLDELRSLLSLSHSSLRAHSSPLVGDVTVRSVRVRGLDSLTELFLLEPVSDSPAALNSSIAFATLAVDVTIAVSVRDTLTNSSYTQESTLSLSLKNVAFSALAIVDIDAHFLDHLSVDQLHLLGCWLAVVREVSLSSLSLTYSELSLMLTQHSGEGNDAGRLEREIAGILDDFSLLLLSPAGYGEAVLAVAQGVLQGPVRAKINAFFLDALTKAKADLPCLTHYPYDDDSALTVWADNAIVHTIYELSEKLLGEDGSGLNKLMYCATNGTGTLVYHGERTVLSLSGLDTFSQLALFATQPDRPYDLQFKAAIEWFSLSVRGAGRTSVVGERSVEASTDDVVAHLLALLYVEESLSHITTSSRTQSLTALEDALLQSLFHTFAQKHSHVITAPSPTPHNALTNSYGGPSPSLTLSLAHTTFSLDVHAEMSGSAVSDLTFSQTHTQGCVASTLNTLSLATLSLNTSQANVSRTATEEFPRDISALINRVLTRLGSDDRLQRKNEEYAIKLENAPMVCAAGGVQPSSNDEIAESVSRTYAWEWELAFLSLAGIFSLFGLLVIYRRYGPRTLTVTNKGLTKTTLWPHTLLSQWLCVSEGQYAEEDLVPLSARSLIRDARVPLWVRVGVPAVLLTTVALFIQSNLAPGAVSVMVELVLADKKKVDLGSVFEFGLGNTVTDMWHAEVYVLAVLIAFFSGAWPYCKLFTMLGVWVLPPSQLSVSARERALVWLDALGKWSLVDFFVMMLMLCAFYLQLSILNSAVLVNVTVHPRWGFYGFVLATMLSLGMGHCVLATHRLVCERDRERERERTLSSALCVHNSDSVCERELVPEPECEKEEEEATTRSLSQLEYLFSLPHDTRLSRNSRDSLTQSQRESESSQGSQPLSRCVAVRVTTWGRLCLVVLCAMTAWLIVCADLLHTMGFQFKGLVGLMLRSKANVDYSYVSIGLAMPEHSGVPQEFGVRWLQASFFLFGVAMPAVLVCSCVLLWFLPLSLSTQRLLLVLCEIAQAWAALDVFCVSIAAALLEIQQFASFVVGDSCDELNVLLEKYLDPVLGGDDKCFDVVATLTKNSWAIFCAVVALILLSLLTLGAGHAAIELRRGERGVVVRRGRSFSSLTSAQKPAHSQSHSQNVQSKESSVSSDVSEPLLSEETETRASASHNESNARSVSSSQQTHPAENFSLTHTLSHALCVATLHVLRGCAYVHMLTLEEVLVETPSHNACAGEGWSVSDFSLSVEEVENALSERESAFEREETSAGVS